MKSWKIWTVVALSWPACDAESVEVSEDVSEDVGEDVELQLEHGFLTFRALPEGAVVVSLLAENGYPLDSGGARTPHELFLHAGGNEAEEPKFLRRHHDLLVGESSEFRHNFAVHPPWDVDCSFSADGPAFDNQWQTLQAQWGYEPFHWYMNKDFSWHNSNPNFIYTPTRSTTWASTHVCNYSVVYVPGLDNPNYFFVHGMQVLDTWPAVGNNVPVGYRSVIVMSSPTPVSTRASAVALSSSDNTSMIGRIGMISRN